MTAGYPRMNRVFLTAITLLLLIACGTTAPTRFYILNPVVDTDTSSPAVKNNHISIALASVTLPEHLNRPQIVTRQGGHQVSVDEYNRWAEPLDAHVTTILAENLSLILGTDRISITNRFKNSGFDYQLSVNVLRFDGWPGKEATLVCRWELGRGDESAKSPPQRFSATRPVEGDDYPGLVAALSSMLADLSREIAQRIAAE
jgi:uncharacterized lipoprotein YmbA